MQQIDSRPEESIVSTGILSPSAETLFSEHVVGGQIFLPGVGYLEMMFAATRRTVLKAIAFIRPCVLPVPRPDAPEKCILRCTRRGRDAFEIASWRGVKTSDHLKFLTHFSASFVDIESESIAPTHISERRAVAVKFQGGTYEEQLAAGKYPAATNTCGLSFSLKLPMSLFKAVLHSPSCAQNLQNIMALLSKIKSNMNERHVALRLAQILNAPGNRHRLCVMARYYDSSNFECARFVSRIDYRGIRRTQLVSKSFRELHMTTSGKPPKRQTYSSAQAWTQPKTRMAKKKPLTAQASVGSRTRSRDSLIQELIAITATIIGSAISADAPLMSAGLDSIATTELSALMSERFNTELPQTLLFDHPSLQSVADFLLLERESVPIL